MAPPSRAITGLESRMFGICFSISLLSSGKFLGLMLGKDGGGAVWSGLISFFFSLNSFMFVLGIGK